ncbi:MAG TPA: acyl carrier protein [Candidatus Intestinimonas stercoravium]|uniref:acyl carrier protein n=1 Tax=uncultured Intestinimonas sp. TaxID=1689265 RepID=UPI001F918537|nr:acyl carrier protein [uncultured Intestinimonas sp.]HJA62807.1 acyl carrier protein [Candidatus Intestinimonas stercoravium]
MFEQVRDVIVDTLGCDAEAVTMEASLVDDLEADSLDAVELNMALEEALGFAIDDEELKNMKTVGDIVKYLEAHQE